MLTAALYYATYLNWQVVPIHTIEPDGSCSCGKPRCSSKAKHPRTERGHLEATTDKTTIRDWWRQWPDANVGVRVGEDSGIIVVDIDPRNGGDDALARIIEEKGAAFTKTLTVSTGGGGQHYYYKYTGAPLAKAPRGIDLKATGFVVAPPSIHESGNVYKWQTPPRDGTKMRQLPKWTRDTSARVAERKTATRNGFVPVGERDNAAISYAGSLRRIGLGEAEIAAALSVWSRMYLEEPLEERDVRRISRSAARYEPVTEDEAKEWIESDMADFFVNMHGRDVRWHAKSWRIWTGKVWRDNAENDVMRLARDVSRTLLEMAANASSDDIKKKLRQSGRAAGSERGLKAILGVARANAAISLTDANPFDADPWLFNVQNGTLDLRTGELRRHERMDLLTKIAPVGYYANASAPRFEQFLQETFRDNDVEDYIQRYFGYCLTGDVSEQVFSIFWGAGGNGKSKLIEAIRAVLGNAFVTTIPTSAILDTRFDDKFALGTLRGRRLALASESSRKTLDEEVIKRITGGDTIRGEEKYKPAFEFSPTHKVILVTNNKPRITASHSIVRRIQLVPFLYQPEVDDKHLDKKLAAEAEGILTWMLNGCLAWQAEGLNPPKPVRAATEEYVASEDLIGTFLNEICDVSPKKRASMTALYEAYQMWAVDAGIRYLGKNNFNKALIERISTLRKSKSNGTWHWYGVGIKRNSDNQ
jgi:putative DNA primase/helicase